MADLVTLAKQYHAYERVDRSDFQSRARILQSMWREEHGYPIGRVDERLFGSRLDRQWAEETLANFMGNVAQDLVRREVLDPERSKGKVYGKPRIFDNLLSSQPLCFNLFADLEQDLPMAAWAVRAMGFGQVSHVTSIQFEHSPGRRSAEYTGDKSAFDVFVEYGTEDGKSGFLGIEVKYHENLLGKAASLRPRYEEVALQTGRFREERLPDLRAQPLQQIWRDDLLACSVILRGDYDEGSFVFLYPEGNCHCREAIGEYRSCLRSPGDFHAWTLEELYEAIKVAAGGEWRADLHDRYLDFAKVDRALEHLDA